MKFIEVSKARNLEIDVPVFTINDKGEYGYGKLVKEEKTSKGIERTFEVAYFFGENSSPGIVPIAKLSTNITHVCIPKK